MNIAVLNETSPGEARVALMPDSVKKLVAPKVSVFIESAAGLGAARTDDDYREAGANLRWLAGFTGSSGLVVLGADERLFFTDFRYTERAGREVAPEFERVVIDRGLIPDSAKRLRGRLCSQRRVLATPTSVRVHDRA